MLNIPLCPLDSQSLPTDMGPQQSWRCGTDCLRCLLGLEVHKVARTTLWKKMLGARAAEEEGMKGERELVNFQVLSHRGVSQKLWALHPARGNHSTAAEAASSEISRGFVKAALNLPR